MVIHIHVRSTRIVFHLSRCHSNVMRLTFNNTMMSIMTVNTYFKLPKSGNVPTIFPIAFRDRSFRNLQSVTIAIPRSTRTKRNSVSHERIRVLMFRVANARQLIRLSMIIQAVLIAITLICSRYPFFSIFKDGGAMLIVGVRNAIMLGHFVIMRIRLRNACVLYTTRICPNPFTEITKANYPMNTRAFIHRIKDYVSTVHE